MRRTAWAAWELFRLGNRNKCISGMEFSGELSEAL